MSTTLCKNVISNCIYEELVINDWSNPTLFKPPFTKFDICLEKQDNLLTKTDDYNITFKFPYDDNQLEPGMIYKVFIKFYSDEFIVYIDSDEILNKEPKNRNVTIYDIDGYGLIKDMIFSAGSQGKLSAYLQEVTNKDKRGICEARIPIKVISNELDKTKDQIGNVLLFKDPDGNYQLWTELKLFRETGHKYNYSARLSYFLNINSVGRSIKGGTSKKLVYSDSYYTDNLFVDQSFDEIRDIYSDYNITAQIGPQYLTKEKFKQLVEESRKDSLEAIVTIVFNRKDECDENGI